MQIRTRDIGPSVAKYAMAQYGGEVFYVDGTNGNDLFDGKSWSAPKATIQAAINVAQSWSTIYIKSATYAENLVLSTPSISLIGEQATGVIIDPQAGNIAIEITPDLSGSSPDYCSLTNMTVIGPDSAVSYAVDVRSCQGISFRDLIVGNRRVVGRYGLRLRDVQFASVENIRVFPTFMPSYPLRIYDGIGDTSGDIEIHHCVIDGAVLFGISIITNGSYFLVHDNTVRNCVGIGLVVGLGSTQVAIFHNNLHDNATNAANGELTAVWFENYYDDAGPDDDNDGLADAAYAFATGSDDSPVVDFNGWERKALGIPKPT